MKIDERKMQIINKKVNIIFGHIDLIKEKILHLCSSTVERFPDMEKVEIS